jgi:rhodanese-related sulfurtransferase
MQRRSREHHHHRTQDRSRRNSIAATLRKPGTQIAILFVAALIVFVILQRSAWKAAFNPLPETISVKDAYTMYQSGAFVLDVRTQEEWNEAHIPKTTLIPLDQLPTRIHEVPNDRPIVVVCRSGNRSQQGRDILIKAGFEAVTSMSGGITEWRSSGYPLEP